MKAAVNIISGVSSGGHPFQVWKLIEPLEMNLDGDPMNHTIQYIKIVFSDDDKYYRTVALPCNQKGKETIPIPLLIMAGQHQPYFILNVLGYSGDFETGLLL